MNFARAGRRRNPDACRTGSARICRFILPSHLRQKNADKAENAGHKRGASLKARLQAIRGLRRATYRVKRVKD